MRSKRERAHRYGLQAERIAACYLRCKGYRILAERYRNAFGEIDLVARKRGVLVAIEVKARASIEACEDTVTPFKQRKIARAALGFLSTGRHAAGLARGSGCDIRFDVIWIAPWRWPVHIKDAWRM